MRNGASYPLGMMLSAVLTALLILAGVSILGGEDRRLQGRDKGDRVVTTPRR